MIKIAVQLLVFVTFLISLVIQPAFAQNEGSVSTSSDGHLSTTIDTQAKTAVILDASAVFNRGFGIGFMRTLGDSVTGLVHYSNQKLEDEDGDDEISSGVTGSYSAEHRAEEYGVRFDYYFNSVYRSGFYVGAGLNQINLETKVDPVFSDEKRILKTDKFGAQSFVGYNIRTGSVAAKIGLGYGNGGAFSNNLGGTKNEIKNDLLVDASVSFIF